MRILFLCGSLTDPSSRFRILQFVQPLRSLGHHVQVRTTTPNRTWRSRLRNPAVRGLHGKAGAAFRAVHTIWNLRDASSYDVVMTNRDLVPEPGVEWVEPWLARRNPRLIFDFDDAIHLGRREAKLRRVLPLFALLTPGNEYLAAFARTCNRNVTIWPTVIDADQYRPTESRQAGVARIGWSGSTTTARECLPLLEEPMKQLARKADFEFLVICNTDPKLDWKGVRTRFRPWTSDDEVQGLQELDFGCMPLKDAPFERGKCGLKAIQYMGVGVPALVSPVGVNKEIVQDGVTGYHCRITEDWVARALSLIQNREMLHEMGRVGRQRVESHYSVKALLPRMVESLERVRRER